ncbi:exodeoxyribonuclease V subunit alpha [Rugamonas sp.]|uniref:exodeoxyribonuclease V subunit alpha n=1 Tax=Rugamonas sp. TaxID=1926287 RepID=UPI0025FA6615|nr:exodeoxyribonuclease V subunit alpha [Rugamonas sp.]
MMNDPSSPNAALLAQLDLLTDAGKLRRLSGAFARFIGTVGQATPPLLLACALLSELEGRGHSCLMLDELAMDPCGLMGWSEEEWAAVRQAAGGVPERASAWREALAAAPQVWPVAEPDQREPLVLAGERLYLRRYWRDETAVADTVRARALELRSPDLAAVRHWLDLLFDEMPAATAAAAAADVDGAGPDWQKIACAVAVHGNLAIITGGPGTGKTYTVARLLALLFALAGRQRDQLRVALAAPTGKAAARLKQSIDHALDGLAGKVGAALPLRELAKRMGSARTLHSLLGARPDTRAFQHHRGNPLDVDVLIVDEASMVHLEMMASLMEALPPHAMLILLGDKDQLASVEAGAVLGDLCHEAQAGGYTAATLDYVREAAGQDIPPQYRGDAGALAQQTVMLRHSRRFSGPIGALALAVNAGDGEAVRQVLRGDSGGKVAWIEPAQQADVLQLALAGRAGAGGYRPYLTLVKDGAATMAHEDWVRAVLASFESFRILCAVRDGEWGVSGLNASIEQSLEKAGLLPRRGEWYVGRPVMVTRNDYGTQVFNGDIGLTLPDPARPGYLRVYFSDGEKVRSVLATRLRHVETAFAMTVHKSQGSEFGHTVLVLPRDGAAVIARELIYTGITRARDMFTLVSPTPQLLLEAVALRTHRASGLRGLIGA